MEKTTHEIFGRWIIILSLYFLAVNSVHFVFKPTLISGESMLPTLEDGDRILLNTFKNTYNRGDIVVFRIPEDRLLIKRVIGIGGDNVQISDGFVYLNGEKLDEFYINGQGTLYGVEMVVPPGHVYLMGDNRSNSVDSRIIGAVLESDIIGSLMLRIFRI